MRVIIGEYNESLKKLYGSLKKRFNLDYEETSEEVDRILDDEEFLDYAVIFISNDDTYSKEFIAEVNAKGDAYAFGFYKDGELAYKNVHDVREMMPKLLDGDGQRFVYVSVDMRSYFKLLFPKTICIKQGREHGQLRVEVVKTREIIENELIRMLDKADLREFNELLNELYVKRWENRPDIFDKGYRLTSSELLNLCKKNSSKSAVVCVKDERIVGFIVYEYVHGGDNRAFNNSSEFTIKDIYVDKAYRRQGVATRMYEYIVKILEKVRFKRIRFKVWDYDMETKKFVSSLQSKVLYTLYELDV